MLPNFIIVGAPKAGTTSLHKYMDEHPDVFVSTPKEVNFFSYDELSRQNLVYDDFRCEDLAAYEALFAPAGDAKAVGEASVSYLFYPQTPAKIKQTIPDVKIIMILRDPIKRGFSHWLMDHRLGWCKSSYEDILDGKAPADQQAVYYQQYVELGLYHDQVKRYLDLFGENNVKVYLQEDLFADMSAVMRDVFEFLQIDPDFKPDLDKKYNTFQSPKNSLIGKLYSSYWLRQLGKKLFPGSLKSKVKSLLFEKGKKPELSDALHKRLLAIYKDDIIKLEQLIERDLSKWYAA